MADTNLEQTVFEYFPRIPIQFIPKPNKYVITAEEFNNYMYGLTTACNSYYTCIKELQQEFDSKHATGVANKSITTEHLKDKIITSDKIALKNIYDKHIAQDAISHNKIAADAFYQLLRKTYDATSTFSESAVKEIVFEYPANKESITGYYNIPYSTEAHGIIFSCSEQLSSVGTNCHVLFRDGFRISLTNPLDQGKASDAALGHVLSTASYYASPVSTMGLAVTLCEDDDKALVLNYVVTFWSSRGPSSAGTHKLYYALF
jgi:hypothetical protein